MLFEIHDRCDSYSLSTSELSNFPTIVHPTRFDLSQTASGALAPAWIPQLVSRIYLEPTVHRFEPRCQRGAFPVESLRIANGWLVNDSKQRGGHRQ